VDGTSKTGASMPNRKKKNAVSEIISPQSGPRGLGVSEAAVYLGATVNFVRALIRDREIPALTLGKRHVLLREDLDEFLDAQRRRVA